MQTHYRAAVPALQRPGTEPKISWYVQRDFIMLGRLTKQYLSLVLRIHKMIQELDRYGPIFKTEAEKAISYRRWSWFLSTEKHHRIQSNDADRIIGLAISINELEDYIGRLEDAIYDDDLTIPTA